MSSGSRSASNRRHRVFGCLALLLGILFPLGDALAQLRDAAGSKDHPLIKRFEGSTILGYEFLKFNELVILLGPVKGKVNKEGASLYEEGNPWAKRPTMRPTNSQRVEGEMTRILYVAPRQHS